MGKFKSLTLLAIISAFFICNHASALETKSVIKLPKPSYDSDNSIEQCLMTRRSVRSFADKPLSIEMVSQILWSAQGKTGEKYGRTAPSAGALYPLELFIVVENSNKIPDGIYHYIVDSHSIELMKSGKFRDKLSESALGQKCVKTAPINLVITGVVSRTAKKYGDRAERYMNIEVGSVCQNVYLQCESLKLGTVAVGAFEDDKVSDVLDLDETYSPLLIMPVGIPF